MKFPREAFDTVDFYGLSLDVVTRGNESLVASVEHRVDNLELRHALRYFSRNDRILVAGGGMGGGSALIAQKVGVERVVTYEANPTFASLSREQVFVRGQTLDIRHGALSDRDGTATFYVSPIHWPASSLYQEFAPSPQIPFEVPTIDTARVIREEGITALLLDVEKAEDLILPHINLAALRAMVVELHFAEDQVNEYVRMIEAAGLRIRDRETWMPSVTVVAATKRR